MTQQLVGPVRTGTQWKASGLTGASNFLKKITKVGGEQKKHSFRSEILRTEYIQDTRMWKDDIPARYLRNKEAPLELPLYGRKCNLADIAET